MATQGVGAIAADSEAWLKRKACLYCSPCVIQFAGIRQGCGELETRQRILWVSLDGPPQPYNRFSGGLLPQLGATDHKHPLVCSMIAGRQAKRLTDMGFGFCTSTN